MLSTKRIWQRWILASVVTIAPTTGAEVNLLSKYAVRTVYSTSNEELDNTSDFYGSTFQVKSRAILSESLSIVMDGRVGTDDVKREGYGNSQLGELFLRYSGNTFDITAGRKVFSWGKADGINPVDVVSSKNYLTLLPESADQRKGSDALGVSYFLPYDLTLDLVAVVTFEPSDIVLPESFGVDFQLNDNVDVSVNRPELAVKISGALKSLDWSVYGYKGHSSTPEAYALEETALPLLLLRYPELNMVGLDFAGAISRYTYRAEMAVKDYGNSSGASGFGRYYNLVAGIERKFGDYLNLNIQYLYNRKLGRKSGSGDDLVGFFNDLIQFAPEKNTSGMSFRLADAWRNGYLKAEVFSIYYFVDDSYFYQIEGEYSINDYVNVSAGYKGYRGAGDSLYGVYRDNARAFLELRYAF